MHWYALQQGESLDDWNQTGVSVRSETAEKEKTERCCGIETQDEAIRFVLAAGAWLRQKILTTRPQQPDRHARKRIARAFGNVPTPNIQVVQLRRTASAPHDSASVSERDWHCQWMVRGHWRNQYYASSGDHMPKYIHPYIKGPEDKPLKPPSGEIFAVTR